MTDADHPTASSRPHVTDMFHAALTTLPHGGAGSSEPQADADLAIDPKLGSRIASLLSRLYQPVDKIGCRAQRHNRLGRKAPMLHSMLCLPWAAAIYQRAVTTAVRK